MKEYRIVVDLDQTNAEGITEHFEATQAREQHTIYGRTTRNRDDALRWLDDAKKRCADWDAKSQAEYDAQPEDKRKFWVFKTRQYNIRIQEREVSPWEDSI